MLELLRGKLQHGGERRAFRDRKAAPTTQGRTQGEGDSHSDDTVWTTKQPTTPTMAAAMAAKSLLAFPPFTHTLNGSLASDVRVTLNDTLPPFDLSTHTRKHKNTQKHPCQCVVEVTHAARSSLHLKTPKKVHKNTQQPRKNTLTQTKQAHDRAPQAGGAGALCSTLRCTKAPSFTPMPTPNTKITTKQGQNTPKTTQNVTAHGAL